MSILTSIEAEFQAIIADARSVPEKLAALVDLHSKSQQLTTLEPALTNIIVSGDSPEAKVEAILRLVGML